MLVSVVARVSVTRALAVARREHARGGPAPQPVVPAGWANGAAGEHPASPPTGTPRSPRPGSGPCRRARRTAGSGCRPAAATPPPTVAGPAAAAARYRRRRQRTGARRGTAGHRPVARGNPGVPYRTTVGRPLATCQPGIVTLSQPCAETAPACAPGLSSRLASGPAAGGAAVRPAGPARAVSPVAEPAAARAADGAPAASAPVPQISTVSSAAGRWLRKGIIGVPPERAVRADVGSPPAVRFNSRSPIV